MVLVEVDVVLSSSFGMNDPDGGLFGQAECQQVEGGGEVRKRADEAERETGGGPDARGKDCVLGEIA
jgi:hypothetical protein